MSQYENSLKFFILCFYLNKVIICISNFVTGCIIETIRLFKKTTWRATRQLASRSSFSSSSSSLFAYDFHSSVKGWCTWDKQKQTITPQSQLGWIELGWELSSANFRLCYAYMQSQNINSEKGAKSSIFKKSLNSIMEQRSLNYFFSFLGFIIFIFVLKYTLHSAFIAFYIFFCESLVVVSHCDKYLLRKIPKLREYLKTNMRMMKN